MTNTTREHVRIPAGADTELDCWLYLPSSPPSHPTVVMAHGIGGVKAAGLAPFAEFFADNGFAALVFDYRHWGRSGGEPREFLSIRRQREDYRTALAWARRHDSLDNDRLFIWGTSFAGMHILDIAATDPALAGAIAQCPLVDGLAGMGNVAPPRALRLTATAVADVLSGVVGNPPKYLPLSVGPDSLGVIATNDSLTGLHRLTPTDGEPWPNRITARSLLDIAVHRPVRTAHRIQCPLLMVVAESDTMAPTGPATQAAARAPRGELYRSRGGHYDVYDGGIDHSDVLRVELEFLTRHARSARQTSS
ncbi:alpha/beta hydrolase [Nocardia sp. NPDC059239]|uniref:alpha/beta hydrolase n=1 Tax=unclassified Nocardia TaxID=2637762 RepID=UPI00368CB989